MSALKIGDKVRLTVKFLRNTGQAFRGEGAKRWVVVECDAVLGGCGMCKRGTHVPVNERQSLYDGTAATIARHVAIGNLEAVK